MLRTFNTHVIRRQLELSGLWRFKSDLEKKGIMVAIPSCWETYPNHGLYRGKGIYETKFIGKGNLRVLCKGVSHTANVFVDGQQIAVHYNAYTPFSGILLGASEGEHTLKIEVSNAFTEESSLHVPNDYMTYGGIHRPVAVEEIDDVYIEWVHAMPELENDVWKLKLKIKVTNISDCRHSIQTTSQLMENIIQSENVYVEPNSSVLINMLMMPQSVEAYTMERPKLYFLETQLYIDNKSNPVDDLIERLGFRVIGTQGKELQMNGQQIEIKGVCRHEDHPMFGCALPLTAMDYDLNIIMDLGANAVRTSHYPNDELFLDLCDEKGILVWEESHARGLDENQMRNSYFNQQSKDCIREMIENHFNHPSIIIWGVLNECESNTEFGYECYQAQINQIKTMDPSRLTSFASNKFYTDICFGLPDIVSINIYPRWYHEESPKEYLDKIYNWVQQDTEGRGKPFIISEIGAGGIYGNRNPYGSKWSEERQAVILKEQVSAVLSKQDCNGVFIWQFCDGRISEEWFHVRPRTMNNKGIVDEYRRHKLAYSVIQELYTNSVKNKD